MHYKIYSCISKAERLRGTKHTALSTYIRHQMTIGTAVSRDTSSITDTQDTNDHYIQAPSTPKAHQTQ